MCKLDMLPIVALTCWQVPAIIADMASNPPSLGARIRRGRQLAQLSQEELAKAVGASTRAVGDWENDRRKPRNKLPLLERVLGIRLEGEPEPEPATPRRLVEEIMNTDGLTPEERRAVLDAVERTLATERGTASYGGAPPARPERERPAS